MREKLIFNMQDAGILEGIVRNFYIPLHSSSYLMFVEKVGNSGDWLHNYGEYMEHY